MTKAETILHDPRGFFFGGLAPSVGLWLEGATIPSRLDYAYPFPLRSGSFHPVGFGFFYSGCSRVRSLGRASRKGSVIPSL